LGAPGSRRRMPWRRETGTGSRSWRPKQQSCRANRDVIAGWRDGTPGARSCPMQPRQCRASAMHVPRHGRSGPAPQSIAARLHAAMDPDQVPLLSGTHARHRPQLLAGAREAPGLRIRALECRRPIARHRAGSGRRPGRVILRSRSRASARTREHHFVKKVAATRTLWQPRMALRLTHPDHRPLSDA
jgi:hypothetical protein